MKISVVLPCYNEEGNIKLLYSELRSVLTDKYEYEIIFVDDGSVDGTLSTIKEIAMDDRKVKGISLSRNFGHQSAIIAGMNSASGDYIITMDADMQHPPTLIPTLINKANEGYDIVLTIRKSTVDAKFIKRITSHLFYRFFNYLSDIPLKEGSADFRLMTRNAANVFLGLPEKVRFNRGLINWMGFKTAFVEYHSPRRISGKSKYTFIRMIKFAIAGILSFSSKPLKIPFILGLLSFIFGLGYSIYGLVQFINGLTIPGWASTIILILMLGGAQMLSLGIVGLYIARIFEETKQRPIYIIKERINIE
jgi:dolichol-phosphate mannosyltransferase